MEQTEKTPEQTESKLLFLARLRTWFTLGILVILLAGCAGLVFLGVQLRHYEAQVSRIVQRVDDITAQLHRTDWEGLTSAVNDLTRGLEDVDLAETVKALDEVSRQLQEIDWIGLNDDLGELLVQAEASLADAQEALTKTSESLDALDIETLNEAISDLKTVIEPLANFTSRFG